MPIETAMCHFSVFNVGRIGTQEMFGLLTVRADPVQVASPPLPVLGDISCGHWAVLYGFLGEFSAQFSFHRPEANGKPP